MWPGDPAIRGQCSPGGEPVRGDLAGQENAWDR